MALNGFNENFHRLIITEVNSKAEGEDFFELYNYGDTAINLDGWKWIDSDADFTSADAVAIGDITLMPGETLVVVSADAVDAEASFREAWGLGDDVQVIVTDGKGLGGDDAVVVFDAMGNTAAALNYGTAAVTTSDSIVVDPVMLSNGTSSLGGHAGEAAGAFETTSLVWTGDSAEEPVYTYAAEGMIGGTEQQNPEDGTGSPGIATTNVATHLDTFTVGGEGAAEISAYDATTQKLFVTNAELNRIDVLDLSNQSNVTRLTSIDISAYGGNVNSVAVDGGRLAMAIEADVKQDPGKVVVLSTDDFSELASVTVGALPDMVTFTPDGNFILSANEGEPNADYSVDPDGTVSIIDTSDYSVTTLDFSAFNDQEEALEAEGMRVFGPGADLAADVEPEYITVSDDSATAWVALQENNAIAEVDLASKTITAIHPLGFKDYSLEENAFDASDKDGEINITTWPVQGIYMPDSLASYAVNGTTYLVTANEGDAREYDTFEEEARIEDLALDETAFPDAATLQTDDAIGRLKVTTTLGDTDNDGDYDELYSFGARSFTIWSDEGEVVFDSGSDIETFTSILNSSIFNQDEGEFDERSDAKGPEPEGLAIGEVDGTVYAFVGLERTGGVMVYDITTPESASFVQWISTEGDVAPEGLLFIDEIDTLVVSNEVSGTVSTYAIGEPDYVEETYTLQLLHFADAEAGLLASETAPNLAALVDVFEDEYANSITLSGGDNFIPGPFLAAGTDPGVADVLEEITGISYASQGTVDIAIHNVIGVEASTIGNHEFDLGSRALKDAFAYAADFPYLSANLDFSGDDDLNGLYVDTVAQEGLENELASDLAGNIVPSAVLEEGGEKIGLVGATTQLLESISSPSGTEVIGTDQNDMELLAAQLQPVIDDLVAQGVNKIILMAHLQVIANEIELAGKLSGVDIILAAGSNTRLGDSDDEAVAFDGHAAEFVDTYPLELTDKDGNTTLLVNTDNEFTYLGRLVVDFDADGNIITDSIETNTSINGAYAATEEHVAEAWGVEVDDLATTAFAEGTRGSDVAALTDAVQDVIDEKNSNIFGYSDVYLEGERALVRSEETNLGNLSADANAYVAELAIGSEAASSTYIVSLKNGGGIRAQIGTVSAPDPVDGTTEQLPPADGTVTQLDVENSLRFDNQLMMFDTTPEGLKAILEHGVAEGTLQGRFPQVGGVSFSWDPDVEAGERISDIALVGDDYIVPLYDDGVLLATAPDTISLVTLSFLAQGGDGYPMKENGDNFRYIIDNSDHVYDYFLTPIDGKIPATDSASAITAIITGEKTDAGNISWASGDPEGGELKTIAETLRDDLGFAIGVASTVPFSHATPAGVVSHDVYRNNKWDIAHEILFDTAPDVVIGGGYENSYFATTTTNAAGEDKDLDDNGYNDDYDAFVNGTHGTDYVFVQREEDVDGGQALLDAAATVDLSAGDKLFGLFGTSGGNFEYYDVADQPGTPEVTRDIEDPTLADITTATLSVLNHDEDGFFVMFEQGDIDWNNHANDYENMVGGVYDLDQAVLTAEAYVDAGIDGISWENTLVIVTSDHSNSYLRSEEVLGLGNLPTQEGTPYNFSYPDGEVTYSTTSHTNELVTVAARGAGADLFEEYAGLWYDGANIVDNTQIYDVMKAAAEDAGVEHIMLFIGDGMNVEHEVAASRYLYGEDQALAWDSWGSIEDGWSGYATTWDINTYNLYASAAGEEAYDAENFDPVIGYDPALGGTTPYPVAPDDAATQEFLDKISLSEAIDESLDFTNRWSQ